MDTEDCTPDPAFAAVPPLPARMVNEYVYCPRLAYLMWVQQEWSDSAETVDGRHVHRNVDRPGGVLPETPLADGERIHARSVTLTSAALGVIAKLDLIEAEGTCATPVDYKRGRRPHSARGPHAPERVQLALQGLLLRERGFDCREGVLYYAASRERVTVPLDDALLEQARDAVAGLRALAAAGTLPPPLEDSPKCPRCALVGICLPDETRQLRDGALPPRPLAVAADTALPLVVQAPFARIGRDGETLTVAIEREAARSVRLIDVSQVVLLGNASLSTPALHELMARGIPVSWHSHGGWFLGHTVGTGHRNVELRTAQYRASFDPRHCLALARALVAAKIANGRTLLRRNWKDGSAPPPLLEALKRDIEAARNAVAIDSLLGIEGAAAARYFGAFGQLLRAGTADANGFAFDFRTRNRRPPADPVNALLSFAYALLTRALTVTLSAVGFDAYRGFYHQPRYGRPALALDVMEPFRPLIADSVVLQVVNNGEIRPRDFVRAGGGVALQPEARKALIAAFERRLSHEVTHPLFGYRIAYRRLLEVQARLLGRHLLGELPDYPNFTTR
ncbi:CRISPR-associated Cas1 family protein /CRISPR-associated Cas4 family exonuclease [Plasticicumulans lactativorans]|uniref:CRISPR-associated endonuclease Cas1 n=1 Tax=Plasticicumulans lactativorans TaxID=1133106 RepID=A0A4R2KXT3_9GAMM|nr:CRISPR-associated endonuclease Cas1 [Plasticicumulans lactativorans]TCO78834.1 CRISPR-associated Cas1 family protein /CRISPR-associated Cas4 family exonuclease [Plasticicumulans lactativorans]